MARSYCSAGKSLIGSVREKRVNGDTGGEYSRPSVVRTRVRSGTICPFDSMGVVGYVGFGRSTVAVSAKFRRIREDTAYLEGFIVSLELLVNDAEPEIDFIGLFKVWTTGSGRSMGRMETSVTHFDPS